MNAKLAVYLRNAAL